MEQRCQPADSIPGTSNTTLGTFVGRASMLVELETGHTTIPSAIFYERDGTILIDRKAVTSYVEGASGRLMRSLKSVLIVRLDRRDLVWINVTTNPMAA